jgi:hypothetical protein
MRIQTIRDTLNALAPVRKLLYAALVGISVHDTDYGWAAFFACLFLDVALND